MSSRITTRLVGALCAGAVLGALVATGISLRARSGAGAGAHLAAAPEAGLAPDPVAVHYRFEVITGSGGSAGSGGYVAPDEHKEIASVIAALQARLAAFDKSPFDWNDLAEQYLRRAQLDGERADYAAAEDAVHKSLAIIRNPNAGLLLLAKLLSARHEFRDAIALANEHIAQKPTAGAYDIIATAELAMGELPQAVEAANTEIAMKPNSGGYLMRALIYSAQGRDAEAAFDFTRAAQLESFGDLQSAAHLRALWGRFLLRRGDYDGARLVLDEALRVVPDFPLAAAQRAELLLRTGHAKEAAAAFEKAFIASRQVRYLIDQARAQELAGDKAGADLMRDQVETIVRGELGDGGLGHRLDLVEVLVDRGSKLDEAVALAREEVTHRPSFETRFQLGRALLRVGNTEGAAVQVQAALASGAHEAQLYELASRIETRRGNAARAKLYAGLADELDPAAHTLPASTPRWRALGMGAP